MNGWGISSDVATFTLVFFNGEAEVIATVSSVVPGPYDAVTLKITATLTSGSWGLTYRPEGPATDTIDGAVTVA